jgi:hypothetical protein
MDMVTRYIKHITIGSILCIATINAMDFWSFYTEFRASGSGSAAFNPKNVKDYVSFYNEFRQSGSGGAAFDPKNVKDFPSFYAEFNRTGRGGSKSFNPKNVK